MKRNWQMDELIEYFTFLPLIYNHINPYENFDLDMNSRIPIHI